MGWDAPGGAEEREEDHDDWIIWRSKPQLGESGEKGVHDQQSQATTEFLEKYGRRLEAVRQKGVKIPKTSENASGGGFTRRKGWYRTNDIRTSASWQNMEIWVPRAGRGYSQDRIESVWEVW